MLQRELGAWLGEGNSAGSLVTTGLFYPSGGAGGIRCGVGFEIGGCEDWKGVVFTLCNLTSQQAQRLRHRRKEIRSPEPGTWLGRRQKRIQV